MSRPFCEIKKRKSNLSVQFTLGMVHQKKYSRTIVFGLFFCRAIGYEEPAMLSYLTLKTELLTRIASSFSVFDSAN